MASKKSLEQYGFLRRIQIMGFAEQLKRFREAKGLSQDALARASGISVGTIRDYEQGRVDPAFSKAVKLAVTLGVALDEFARDTTTRRKFGRQPKGK